MTAPPTSSMGAANSGWLLARADGTVVAADEGFCALIGAPGPHALIGRHWPSLVSGAYGGRLEAARAAEAAGERWHGTLEFRFDSAGRALAVEILGAGAGAERVTVLRATAVPAGAHAGSSPGSSPVSDDAVALEAAEAVEQAAGATEAGRAALQAVRRVIDFDWGVVLRLDDATTAEVVATYPSGMAGMERGVGWMPLDRAERTLAESGEPALEGELVREAGDTTPLARLPAFGMRSRLQVPLFTRDRVAGCVALYSTRPHAFGPADGIRLERVVRPLRARFGSTRSTPPPVSQLSASAPPERAPAAAEAGSERERDRRRAEQRLTALGEMVSGVAHELNNPLTAILGYSQILPGLEGPDREQALTTIEHEALRASRIVRNLLAFARQHRTTVQLVDAEAVLRRVIDVRRHSLQLDRITVETSFERIPTIMADEYQLEQVFLNLLNNAHQALQPSGGVISVATRRVEGAVRITVADTGPGVPEEMADRVFEPFFTTREVGAGAGMGLAIVYGIVTEHGGHVWVERAPAGGAQFVVELPLVEAPTSGVPPPAAPGSNVEQREGGRGREPVAAPPGPPRVLIVDDELAVRALTNEILSAAGFRVETAAGADEGLRLLDAERFDAVVVDLRMPGMGGEEFYRAVGERWPSLRPSIVVVTSDLDADPAALRLAFEGARLLEKPFDTHALVEAVRAALAAAEA